MPPDPRPIGSIDELVDRLAAAGKPPVSWRVGAEHEKIGVLAESGAPVPYEGERGIAALLARLAADGGWAERREAGALIGLDRGPLSVTLEPGGQLELSGTPLHDLHEVESETRRHLETLLGHSGALGIAWLGLGFRPFGSLADVPWVPKGRYAVMRDVLPRRGRLAHEMMKRTATIQANLDFSDEHDATRKMRAAMSVTSIVTALFANSPIVDGRDSGHASYRAAVWLETDPDRCGLLPFAFEPGDVLVAYVEWALDVPMLFLHRGGYRPVDGLTFRRFLVEGYQGERATLADWELHLSTLFPEVRLRSYLEMRGADSGPLPMVIALPALWKGLLYDADGMKEAIRLTRGLDLAQRLELRATVPRLGLATPVPGHGTALDVARELVMLARAGLSRIAPDEVPALAPLEEVVATGRAPADAIRDAWRAEGGDPARLIERWRYR